MKVCFVGNFSGGGTERVTLQLVNELVKDITFEVTLVSTSSRRLTFPCNHNIAFHNLSIQSLPRKIFELRKVLKELQPNIVVSIEALTGIYTIPATLGLNIRNVVWEHANYYQTQGSRWTRTVRRLWLRYFANDYVVLTKRDLNNFIAHEKIKCRLIQIYNPVKNFEKNSSTYDYDSKIIVSAGHLVPIKRFNLIPRIFTPVSYKHPDWQWHIYGDGSQEIFNALKREIANYNLQDHVILKGASKNMDEVYSKAALYVLTSRQEGLPTVLIEAMLHHLPCISFDIETGPDEIITNNVNGIIVPDNDLCSMSQAIEQLVGDDKIRSKFSDKTSDILQRLDYNTSVLQWVNLLKNK